MNEKVHPVLGENGHGPRPSAPPLSAESTAVAIQMPEKAIRKEQETTLLRDPGQKPDVQTLYGRPPPPPPPSRWSAAAMVPGRPRKRRGSGGCCCCCLVSFVATLATIALIMGLLALVLYLVLKPKAPKFSVTEATINKFDLSKSGRSLDTDVVFSIEARNPNKKISFYYDDVDVHLRYASEGIGQGSIPGFHQPHRNTTVLSLSIHGYEEPLTSSDGTALRSSLDSGDSIPLEAYAATRTRVKVGAWKSRAYKTRIICDFQLSNASAPPPPAHVAVESKSCKFKMTVAHITVTF